MGDVGSMGGGVGREKPRSYMLVDLDMEGVGEALSMVEERAGGGWGWVVGDLDDSFCLMGGGCSD